MGLLELFYINQEANIQNGCRYEFCLLVVLNNFDFVRKNMWWYEMNGSIKIDEVGKILLSFV